jgi:hypothetical protein
LFANAFPRSQRTIERMAAFVGAHLARETASGAVGAVGAASITRA